MFYTNLISLKKMTDASPISISYDFDSSIDSLLYFPVKKVFLLINN